MPFSSECVHSRYECVYFRYKFISGINVFIKCQLNGFYKWELF